MLKPVVVELPPVPPLVTFKTPEISEVKETRPLNRAPAVVDLTGRAWVKELKVVDPVTVRVPVMEVVAKKELPETVKPVEEAVVKLVWPLPQRIPEMEMEVAEAVPKIGVIKVGEVCRTFNPLPVLAVTNRAPPEVDWTLPAVREERVVEPLEATLKSWALVEEATTKMGVEVLPSVFTPWTVRMATGVVELTPILPLALMLKMEVPEEEATLNGSKVVAP